MPSTIARIRGNLSLIPSVIVAAALVGATLSTAPPARAAVATCTSFGSAVRDQVNPQSQAQVLTIDSVQSKAMQRRGFTRTRGTPIRVAAHAGTGLTAVHRLYRPRNGNYFYSLDAAEVRRAVKSGGYIDQGAAFYASAVRSSCLIGVYSFYRAGIHRFVTLPGERAILTDTGWTPEKVRFYVAPSAVDTAFTIAVMPDTQNEVYGGSRFLNRSQWLVAHRQELDLRFVTHTGDIVSWDTPDHAQYRRARDALAPLQAAKIPYSLSVGNHDTAAVGVGGSAIDPPNTYKLVRDTTTFNTYLNRGTQNVKGRFEAYKQDNTYSVFSGGGAEWLVLNLELWPRKAVIAWAKDVVASHPRTNVIVATHSFLDGDGSIHQRIEYGATSPQYLYDNLIKLYPNVRMVLSGHAGAEFTRVFTGVNGNKITAYMLTMHSNTTNPTRLVEIDTSTMALRSWVYSPWTQERYPSYSTETVATPWLK